MRSATSRKTISWAAMGVATMAALLFLAGCSLGDAMMPNPPTGVPADRDIGQVAPIPNPIPHTLEGRAGCFTCHAIGAVDAPAVPPDHEENVTLCTTCHAEWQAPAIAVSAPPAIPHALEGREDCLTCHKLGTADAPRIPDNHDGLPSDLCQTCHTTIGEITGEEVEEGASAAESPSIPHGLEGFGACSSCHAEGGAGIPRYPDDHQGRSDDTCTACHRPLAEAPEATPTTEPAATPTEASPTAVGDIANGQSLFATKCALCHGPEGEGTAVAPDALNDAGFLKEHTDEDLTTAIRMGVGDKMPSFPQLADQDVLDLIALLRSWQ